MSDPVLQAVGLYKNFGALEVAHNINFTLKRGARHALIGPNGAGKTTLFRLITDQEKADSGSLKIGDTVRLGYVDQSRETLNPDHTVWEEISGEQESILLGDREMNSRAYVSRFNFAGADQQKKVGEISGGVYTDGEN